MPLGFEQQVERYFLYENLSIKAEILVFSGIFYGFFNVLLWSDPRRQFTRLKVHNLNAKVS
jgi:hypothetical protein